ncbi:MAG TPA: hypothetical protein VF313_10035 [Anaerolineaceae bacterium]
MGFGGFIFATKVRNLLSSTQPCDYPLYTLYAAGSFSDYPNGAYYWKVEARNSDNVVITTSSNWSFTIVVIYQQYIPLTRKSSP